MYRKVGGILFLLLPCSSVCLFVCPKFNVKTKHSPVTPKFSYKPHIWYKGTFHRYTSAGTKVICKGHISLKKAVSGALVFYKLILFCPFVDAQHPYNNCLHVYKACSVKKSLRNASTKIIDSYRPVQATQADIGWYRLLFVYPLLHR